MENNDIPAAKHHTAIAVERPFRHSITVQLRFNDFDMLGHLNNSMYFSYFDIGKGTLSLPEFPGHHGRENDRVFPEILRVVVFFSPADKPVPGQGVHCSF